MPKSPEQNRMPHDEAEEESSKILENVNRIGLTNTKNKLDYKSHMPEGHPMTPIGHGMSKRGKEGIRRGNGEDRIENVYDLAENFAEVNARVAAVGKIDTLRKKLDYRKGEENLEKDRVKILEQNGFKVEFDPRGSVSKDLKFSYRILYEGKLIYQAGDFIVEYLNPLFKHDPKVHEIHYEELDKLPKEDQEAFRDFDEWRRNDGKYGNGTGITLDLYQQLDLITRDDYERIARARDDGKVIMTSMIGIPLKDLEEEKQYEKMARGMANLDHLLPSGETDLGQVMVWAIAEKEDKK
jgi:hypothetical protein